MNRFNLRRLTGSPLLSPALVLLAAVLVLLADRIWPGTAAAPYLQALGAAALMAAATLHLPPFLDGGGAAALRPVAGWLLAPYALLVPALALYHASGWLPGGGVVDWADLARAGWALAALAGLVLLAFLTLARLSQRRVPGGDPRRIRLAGSAGLSLALLTVLVVLLNVVFARLPWQWNLAYFQTTRPSEATREMAQTLPAPVEVALFFAVDSEVRPLMETYFGTLQAALNAPPATDHAGADPAASAGTDGTDGTAAGPGSLRIRFLDAHLNPAEAEAFKVRDNGWLALRRGAEVQQLHVGERLEQARATLRQFDQSFFSKLAGLARPKVVVYLTVGHGERAERASGDTSEQSLDKFRAALLERNYAVKELGLTDGLADRVPEDAALVVSTAPTAPFLTAEADALRTYLNGGGRMLAFVEPEARGNRQTGGLPGVTLAALLKEFGVTYDPQPLAHDRFHARRTNTRADRTLLFTAQYQAHPAAANLRRTPTQFPLLMLGAGGLRVEHPPADLDVKPLVLAMPGTWADGNGNFEFDAGTEVRGQPALAVGIARKSKAAGTPSGGPRPSAAPSQPLLVVFGDVDLASDLLLPYRANRLAVEDALGWLVARDAPVGLPASEADVPIQHARSEDWLWFYLPILGVPALVLVFGGLRVSRQRRRQGDGDA